MPRICRYFFLTLFFLSMGKLNATSKSVVELEKITDINLSILDRKISLSWGDDPFTKTPGFSRDTPIQKKLELNAIFFNDDLKVAIINNEEVYEGSIYNNYNIKTIGKNFVLLKKGRFLTQLTLPSPDLLNPEIIIEEHTERHPTSKDHDNDDN